MKKKAKFQIVNIGEEADNFLQPFFFTANHEFPHLEVGYEKNSSSIFNFSE